jgi:hypothetical protein
MAVKDILVGEDGDLQISKGDFFVGDSDLQHITHIVFASPGDYKQSPIIGVGIMKKLNSPVALQGANSLKSEITLQLTADNYKVKKIVVGSSVSQLKIDAER